MRIEFCFGDVDVGIFDGDLVFGSVNVRLVMNEFGWNIYYDRFRCGG